jgi:small subunit ribosomal protein S6
LHEALQTGVSQLLVFKKDVVMKNKELINYKFICFSNIKCLSLRRIFAESSIKIKLKFMNNYETVFILTPVLSDIQMKEAVEKFKEILIVDGAEIVNEENWGLRKLAYQIQKKSTGFYSLIEFQSNPTTIAKLETQFRRDERVLRFLTFRQDKNFAAYAAKRRNKSKEIKKEN